MRRLHRGDLHQDVGVVGRLGHGGGRNSLAWQFGWSPLPPPLGVLHGATIVFVFGCRVASL